MKYFLAKGLSLEPARHIINQFKKGPIFIKM